MRIRAFSVIPFLLYLTSCGSDSTGPAAVASVVVTPAAVELSVGDSQSLTASVRDASGEVLTGRVVSWSSDATDVATVTNSGNVTAVAPGQARITATSEGKTGQATVTVLVQPVAQVSITPATPIVTTGKTVQLTADLRDSAGRALTDREVTWSSADESIATVDADGLATGISEGVVEITAESEGKTAVVELTVREPGEAALISIDVDTLTHGGTAVLTGAGFSSVAGENLVIVDGAFANVLSASETSLEITVPQLCRPSRQADVYVVVNDDTTNVLDHPVGPSSFLKMEIGEQQVFRGGSEICLQFDSAPGYERYAIGLQSTSEAASSVTQARLRSIGSSSSNLPVSAQRVPTPVRGEFGTTVPEYQRRMLEHRKQETRLRQRERELLERVGTRPAQSSQMSKAQMSFQTIPSVGDTMTVAFPDIASDLCRGISVTAVVRAVGDRGIFLEDTENPSGGFTNQDFQVLSDVFDDKIWETNTKYFGEPSDRDGNERVLILTTQQINRYNETLGPNTGILGFVTTVDLDSRLDACSSGSQGEIYYGLAPDPNNEAGWRAYSRTDALHDAQALIAHEFAHIIQYSRRLMHVNDGMQYAAAWEMEGQATFAEEVVGFAITGRQPGQNYGLDVAFNDVGDDISWYVSGFTDLAMYFGALPQDGGLGKATGAPEQCTWLDSNVAGSPCHDNRAIYGVPWLFLRWLSDNYGQNFAGGEAELQRRLVDQNPTLVGFANIEAVIGEPIEDLLPKWAASLYVDDKVANLEPGLSFTSWNLTSIFAGLVPEAQLDPYEHAFTGFTRTVQVRGGSSAYIVVEGQNRKGTAMEAIRPGGQALPQNMQLWIVRMN